MQACLSLSANENEPSVNEQLLSDIRDILGNRERIASTELLNALIDNDELVWSTYNRGQSVELYFDECLRKSLTVFPVKQSKSACNRVFCQY